MPNGSGSDALQYIYAFISISMIYAVVEREETSEAQ
jgi:hypothetical protein